MTAVTTDRLIAPHGGTLVDRTGDAPADLDSLEVVTLTSRKLSDLDMIASGALSPLNSKISPEMAAAVEAALASAVAPSLVVTRICALSAPV